MSTPGIGDVTPRSSWAVETLGDLLTMLRPAQPDLVRAELVVELAILRVRAVVDPIPEGARPILLEAALRGYQNPTRTSQEAAGPFSRTLPNAGVYLTDEERAELARLAEMGAVAGAARSGAFTIRPGAKAAG